MIDFETEIKEIKELEERVRKAFLPSDLQEKIFLMIQRAASALKFSGQSASLEQTVKYIDWITSLTWTKNSEDVLDLKRAKQILDKNHYGLTETKERILEYLAVLKLQKTRHQPPHLFGGQKATSYQIRAPILCFVGLVGTGKTTIAYSIAEALGRKFIRIPFGGMGGAADLRGQSRVHPDAEAGQVIKALRRCGTKNPVMLFDEIDRVTEAARADIMGVLVELLDPEQNFAFVDHYIDYPFDLSQVLFVATANNTKNISTAVLDRLEPIQMPSYTDEEKIKIAKDYIFAKELFACGLNSDQLTINDEVWPQIVRPLGFDAGIRTLERTVNGICRKVAIMIVEGKGQSPASSGTGQSFHLTKENIKQFLPTW